MLAAARIRRGIIGGYRAPEQVEARALIARMTVAPSSGRARAIDQLVRALKDAGIWPRLYGFWVFAAHDAQAAKLNWKANDSAASVNGPVLTLDRGYQTDGATSYIDLGYAPNIAAQDSVCFGFWSLTSALAPSVGAVNAAGSGISVSSRSQGDRAYGRANSVTGTNSPDASNPDGRGFYVVNRPSANVEELFRNGVQVGGAGNASDAPIATSLALGLRNGASAYVAQQYAAGLLSQSLTAAQQASLHAALATYLQLLGVPV